MNKFINYCKKFANDESGMELLQMAIVVVITVGLIGVVAKLGGTISKKISSSNSQVDQWDETNPLDTGNGSNNPATGN